MLVLAGDIGGTHARLALVEVDPASGPPRILAQRTTPSQQASSLSELIRRFLAGRPERPSRACLALAGPVVNDRVTGTNLSLAVDAGQLREALGLPGLHLINDFLAAGYGIPHLAPEELRVLQEGRPDPAGPLALVGAGTGLGQAYVLRVGGQYRVCASEGGHASLAPDDSRAWALRSWLLERHPEWGGHVSWERVLSGPGLVNLFEFLAAGRETTIQAPLRAAMGGNDGADAPLAVTRFAMARADPLADEALDFFIELYGAAAGNLALTVLATGGVYVTGAIAAAIAPRLAQGKFLAGFRDKGRLAPLLERIPVTVILDPDVGLLGAATCAAAAADG